MSVNPERAKISDIEDVSSPSFSFDTDRVTIPHRLDAWNAAFGSLNVITSVSGTGTHCNCRSENWLLGGGLVVSLSRVTPARFVRDPERARRDMLDHFVLRVLIRGQARLRYKSFEATTNPGELVLFSMHETWTIDWGEAEWVSICIPRDRDLRLAAGLAKLSPGIVRGAGAGLIADMILALPARLAAARPEEIPTLAAAIDAAIRACLVSGVSLSDVVQGADVLHSPAKERVHRAVLRNIGSARLTPSLLAMAAGVSRSALYRLYEAEGGVARYIQYVRLTSAHEALRDPSMAGRSISVIAEAHGFPAHSDFSRAFRAAFGMTPTEVRATVQISSAVQEPAASKPRRGTTPRDIAGIIYGALQAPPFEEP